MAKKKKQKNDKRQDELLEKIRVERELVTHQLNMRFKSAVDIAVDTEFKEVSIMLDQSEFSDNRKNFETSGAEFKFEKADNDMLSLKFSYKLK